MGNTVRLILLKATAGWPMGLAISRKSSWTLFHVTCRRGTIWNNVRQTLQSLIKLPEIFVNTVAGWPQVRNNPEQCSEIFGMFYVPWTLFANKIVPNVANAVEKHLFASTLEHMFTPAVFVNICSLSAVGFSYQHDQMNPQNFGGRVFLGRFWNGFVKIGVNQIQHWSNWGIIW